MNNFISNDIKLKFIGIINFNKKLNNLIKKSEKLTKNNKTLQINLALNYGSKNEILNAVKKIVKKKIVITEKNFTKCLYTKNIPDPEILIRTGKQIRLSNFLLWQVAYSEIFFEKKLWPDFNEQDFINIINKYKKIVRNFGNI
ncbi:polyprenyl diphosphate synthase [Candidatus Pelagibacter sp.]|nr:polyprenyl diphosphate synthase [Candidatus Pelagibacter sp.]